MDWTDRHCRFFHRLISPNALLYTEMIHANAITRGDAERHLGFSAFEKPVALQLGGIDANALALAAKKGQEFGYAEINLNCGCPSDRVQAGAFGACLMAEPMRVAQAVTAMRDAVSIPVTVKTRIGIDEQDSYEFLVDFIQTVHAGGCDVFVLHARKAWLKGLSPKENREKPPLHWDRVHRIKNDFPHLTFVTNGGFETLEDISEQFNHVDGVMIGRKAYHEPYFLAELERAIFKTETIPSRQEIVAKMLEYMNAEQKNGTPLKRITKHLHGLFHAQPNSKAWKHALEKAAQEDSLAPLQPFINPLI